MAFIGKLVTNRQYRFACRIEPDFIRHLRLAIGRDKRVGFPWRGTQDETRRDGIDGWG